MRIWGKMPWSASWIPAPMRPWPSSSNLRDRAPRAEMDMAELIEILRSFDASQHEASRGGLNR